MKTLIEYLEEMSGRQVRSIEGINNKYQDEIEEALTRSFPTSNLIDKISKHYNINSSEFLIIDGKGENKNFSVSATKIYKYLNDKWLLNTLNYFGYYFTLLDKGYIYFEPIFTENITDIVQDDCKGKIYKLVSSEILEKIKNRKGICVDKDSIHNSLVNGSHSSVSKIRKLSNRELNKSIHARLNDLQYRYFFSRTFFFTAESKEGLKKAYNEVIYELANNSDDVYVLEVDISKYNVNCYVDNYAGIDYDKEGFLFIYINAFFPIDIITIYDKKEFERILS